MARRSASHDRSDVGLPRPGRHDAERVAAGQDCKKLLASPSQWHPSSAVRSVRVTFCFQTRLVFVTKSDPSCPHCGNAVGLHLEPRELCTEQTPIRCFCCFKEATAGAWSEASLRPERRVGLPERRRFSRTDRRATRITSKWVC